MTLLGHIRDGQIVPDEPVVLPEGMQVLIQIVSGAGSVDLRQRGIDQNQAADLRGRLKAIAEDWDRPEMDVYDAI